MDNTKRRKAKELLVWYFRLAFEKSGSDFSPDNRAEVEGIIDYIFDGVLDEVKATDDGGDK